jgi:putative transposase
VTDLLTGAARPWAGHCPADPGGDRRCQALRRAALEVFDHPVIQRCQLHKLRNVADRLPDALASTVAKKLRVAYHLADPLLAEAELESLARSLERSILARLPACERAWPRP